MQVSASALSSALIVVALFKQHMLFIVSVSVVEVALIATWLVLSKWLAIIQIVACSNRLSSCFLCLFGGVDRW
jgi:hypothetical protein